MKKNHIQTPNSSGTDFHMKTNKRGVTTGGRKIAYQLMIFVLTYLSYAVLHFTREGWSILKPDIRSETPPGLGWEKNNNAGWVDFFFLFSYSFGLFISGVLGDNYPIRIILPIGYLIVAFMTIMISFGGTWRITSVFYYIIFFCISGLCQSIGWPSCIAVMGNWFSKESRGLIFGIWCTCQNMGNIGGNLLANLLKSGFDMDWMWNFRTIGIIVGVFGVINFILLIDHPAKVNIVVELPEEEAEDEAKVVDHINGTPNMHHRKSDEALGYVPLADGPNDSKHRDETEIVEEEIHARAGEGQAISFWKAWLIPGVLPFAISIAFVKCSTYGMLFWLPTYAKDELDFDDAARGLIAISFDLGTIVGSISLGFISDLIYKKRSPVAFVGLLLGSVFFLLVVFLSSSGKGVVYTLIFFIGFFVGGIFNIVAATAAADLAKGDSLKGNDKALATVSGILDGSGSLGAAFGSLIIGEIARASWNGVFIFLA